MLKKFSLIILSCVSCSVWGAQSYLPCNNQTPDSTECVTEVGSLHPAQSNVGLFSIDMTTPLVGILPKLEQKCASNSLDEDLQQRGSDSSGIAGIIGPNGVIYLVNGHHHAYALNQLANQANSCAYSGRIYVYIIKNKFSLTMAQFDEYMQQHQYVWLKDKTGNSITFNQLPEQINQLGNDNYRSLIKLIEDSNCNKKHVLIDTDNTTPYLEFYWADRLRNLHNVYDNLDATNASTYAIDAYNYIVKQQSLFKDLPGFDPVKLSNLCTNFN